MPDWVFLKLSAVNPVLLAFGAAIITWAITALGSLTVFLLPKGRTTMMEPLLGASAGVMLAACFWSLLEPALAGASQVSSLPNWLVAACGFLAGGGFLIAGDAVSHALECRMQRNRKEATLPKAGPADPVLEQEDTVAASRRRCRLLVASITLHNIPEGLAIGVAFGSLGAGFSASALAAALSVAVGIGLQNFPEGAAVALPLLREGYSRNKAFCIGQLSGIVEPLSALAGAALVLAVRQLLPWALAGAAGAMVYVVAHELLPEAQRPASRTGVTIACLLGFVVMMVLDVALG